MSEQFVFELVSKMFLFIGCYIIVVLIAGTVILLNINKIVDWFVNKTK